MGIKSKIKGSYAYTQWKLGKYTKRRVKTSISPEWDNERQRYEHDRIESSRYYSDSENYNRRNYSNAPNYGTTTSIAYYSDGNAKARQSISPNYSDNNLPKYNEPVSNNTLVTARNERESIYQTESIRNQSGSNTLNQRGKSNSCENITDVLVPSQKYKLAKKSDLNSIGYYYKDDSSNKGKSFVYNTRDYSFTTNTPVTTTISRGNNI